MNDRQNLSDLLDRHAVEVAALIWVIFVREVENVQPGLLLMLPQDDIKDALPSVVKEVASRLAER